MTWRPRFSLLTLLLAALFSGSVMLLWRNRAPWQVLKTITEPKPIEMADFSPHGTFFYTCSAASGSDENPESKVHRTIRIYETVSGKLHAEMPTQFMDGTNVVSPARTEIYFSSNETYLVRITKPQGLSAYEQQEHWSGDTWRVSDGARMPGGESKSATLFPIKFSPRDNFALCVSKEGDGSLVRLPSFEKIDDFRWSSGFGLPTFSHDEKWYTITGIKSSNIPLCLFPTQPDASSKNFLFVYDWEFSPDERHFAITLPFKFRPVELETRLLTAETFEVQARFDPGLLYFADDSRHLAIDNTTKKEAIVYDIQTQKERLRLTTNPDSRLRVIGNRVFNHDPLECYDLDTGARIWRREPSGGQVTDDGAYIVNNPYLHFAGDEWRTRLKSEYLVNAATGEIAHQFQLPEEGEISKHFHWAFAAKQRRMLSVFQTHDANAKDPRNFQITLWHSRRPEVWWGIAWLWEFWLCVVLGIGVCSSAFRRQRVSNPTPVS